MRSGTRLAALVWLAMAGSGCALLHARTPAPGPALEAPAAPAHEVPPPAATPIEPVSPVLLPSPPPSAEATPATGGRRPASAPAAAPAPPAPVADVPPPPSPTLQTTPDVEAAIRRVRNVLDRASGDLRRVRYQALGSDGKTQYQTARRFMQQAEDALLARNVAYAGQLADKAAALAANLPKG